MAKLIVSLGGREKSFDLVDDVVFLGSGEGNHLRIPAQGVAERQCQILKVDGSYRLVDLTGAGTLVNGSAVTQQPLENGDRIQLGQAVVQFRGGVQPAGAATPAAAAPAAGGTTRSTRRTSRRGATGRTAGKEVRVAAGMQQAASQREVMIRKRVRKGGLSGPATAAIGVAVVTVLILCGYALVTKLGNSNYASIYERGYDAIRNGNIEEARALLSSIPESAGAIYSQAQKRLEEIEQRAEARVDLDQHQAGVRWYENQIAEFVRNKIDPATRKKDYDNDQPAQLRYVMKRIDHFLAEFKGHKFYPDVEALAARYRPLAPTGPPGFRDIWVEAEYEKDLRRYGYSYVLLKKWMGENPGAKQELGAANRLLEGIILSAKNDFKYTDKDARGNIEGGNYREAYHKYETAAKRYEGMVGDDMPKVLDKTAMQLAEELQRRVNELKP